MGSSMGRWARPQDSLISAVQVAKILGVDRRTVNRAVTDGKLEPATKYSQRFDVSELRRFIERRAAADAEWLYRARVEIDRVAATLPAPLPDLEGEKPAAVA